MREVSAPNPALFKGQLWKERRREEGWKRESSSSSELGPSQLSVLPPWLTIIIRCRSAISGTRPLQSRMTVPVGSRPLRPARPAICTYSPGSRSRKVEPSCFRMESNTTVRAGIFTPMAKVSVANKTWDGGREVQQRHPALAKCTLLCSQG